MCTLSIRYYCKVFIEDTHLESNNPWYDMMTIQTIPITEKIVIDNNMTDLLPFDLQIFVRSVPPVSDSALQV